MAHLMIAFAGFYFHRYSTSIQLPPRDQADDRVGKTCGSTGGRID